MNKLDQLTILHKKLLDLSEQKKEAITKGQMDLLEKIMNEEQKYIKAINQLENERQTLVEQIVITHNGTLEEPVKFQILESYGSPEEIEVLRNQRETLLDITEKLRTSNQLNQQLIYQSLQFVNLSIDMLRPQEAVFNYDNKPANAHQGPANKKSMFDSKA